MKRKSLIGAIIGALFTPVAVALALKSAGQGDFYWAGVFFPILTLILLKGGGPLVVPFVLLQYPFYGWYTGRCITREHYIRLVVLLLIVQIVPMLVTMFY